MNNWLLKLNLIAKKEPRLIIGLMSGTSLDGLDIALCEISGSGLTTKATVKAFETIPYDKAFKNQIQKIAFKKTVDLKHLCLLHKKIGALHGQMVKAFLNKINLASADVDLIASHGQTIYHAPVRSRSKDETGNATLQIGDADQLAVNAGIIAFSDFRQKNIAQGLEGAPLAIYGDFLLFKNSKENRVLLNIGGIANFTYLPVNGKFEDIISTDVGPGNTLMDQFINSINPSLFYDENAKIAALGKINHTLLNALLNHPFFDLDYPKTTGPELFNLDYLTAALKKTAVKEISNEGIMATLNRFSAVCIEKAIKKLVPSLDNTPVYLSGGGVHNPLLKSNLKLLIPEVQFKNIADLGINPDAKEALLFAILANETLTGNYRVFGGQTLSMGKISLPS
ncbi:anhydro-N-acetylmuramic acid kinase [Pedobacter sp. SD-b]|uniref:Anhydro-N-acetylmuramic acid kinase n=1 Tax=Pedobacter segetis TaxID=2793069 RepID=A0ABS1BF25_9SPHI|nr:anhydro-N-acetylmuramic acid kinase [Pedobacter segetis]MBK0381455.1 anhydro-N-acetylmuramic acid kinase [Pedobacter segetis]